MGKNQSEKDYFQCFYFPKNKPGHFGKHCGKTPPLKMFVFWNEQHSFKDKVYFYYVSEMWGGKAFVLSSPSLISFI